MTEVLPLSPLVHCTTTYGSLVPSLSAAARPCARSTCTATVPSAMRPSCRGDAGEMWGDDREICTGDVREIYRRYTGDTRHAALLLDAERGARRGDGAARESPLVRAAWIG